MKPVREPDAGDPQVRFDERRWETELRPRLRHRHQGESRRQQRLPRPTATAPAADSTDPDLEDRVRYSFGSQDGLLWVWNVYEMSRPGGQVFEEKWTENAGFWVERVSESERIYHCSHGMANPPDFESLVFRLRIFDVR